MVVEKCHSVIAPAATTRRASGAAIYNIHPPPSLPSLSSSISLKWVVPVVGSLELISILVTWPLNCVTNSLVIRNVGMLVGISYQCVKKISNSHGREF